MTKQPSLRQLRYFIAVAEAASFRRAALRLRVSQPTLSTQVAAFESALEVQLFERSQAGSWLTPAGKELLTPARRVVEEFQSLLDRAVSIKRGPTGTHRLGVTPTLGPYLLPVVLPEIHRRFEALKFYVREGAPQTLESDLIAGDHDLILTALPVSAGDLIVAPLFREPLRLIVASDHRFAGRTSVAPDELRDEPVLTLEEHHHFHHQIRELSDRLGARLLRDYEGTSLDTLRQMVVMGVGVAFLPALYVRSEIHESAALHVTQVEGEVIERVHALAWRRSSPAHGLFRTLANDIRDLVLKIECAGVELADR